MAPPDVSYEGQAPALWRTASMINAAAGTVMAATVFAYAFVLLVGMLRGATPAGVPKIPLQTGPRADARAARWAARTAPTSVAVLILGIYGLTAFAFGAMRALPVLASGSGH